MRPMYYLDENYAPLPVIHHYITRGRIKHEYLSTRMYYYYNNNMVVHPISRRIFSIVRNTRSLRDNAGIYNCIRV